MNLFSSVEYFERNIFRYWLVKRIFVTVNVSKLSFLSNLNRWFFWKLSGNKHFANIFFFFLSLILDNQRFNSHMILDRVISLLSSNVLKHNNFGKYLFSFSLPRSPITFLFFLLNKGTNWDTFNQQSKRSVLWQHKRKFDWMRKGCSVSNTCWVWKTRSRASSTSSFSLKKKVMNEEWEHILTRYTREGFVE